MTRASFRSFSLVSFFLFIGATLPACSGTSGASDLFSTTGGEGPPTGAGGSGQGGTGQGGTGQGGAGQGGMGQGGMGQGGAAQSSSSASSTAMASSSSSSSAASSSSGGPMATIACGNESCPVGGDNACCFDRYQINPPPQFECMNAPANNDTCSTGQTGRETRIECQLPSHCPAAAPVCCGTFNQSAQNSWYSLVTCEAQCGGITLCDPANPQCPAPTTCKTSSTLPTGYYVCRN